MLGRYLDSGTAYAEILFGLIMALTFTLGASLLIDIERSHEIVYGVVACNVAWGIIDAVFYILAALYEVGLRGLKIMQVQAARSTEEALKRLHEEFDERFVPVTTPAERERIYQVLHQLVLRMEVPEKRLTRETLKGSLAVFILVAGTSLPVLLPELLFADARLAFAVANFLLVVCLFLAGYAIARAVRGHSIRFGFITAAVGIVLVVIAKALGG